MDKYNALCYLSTLNKVNDLITLISFLLLVFAIVIIPIFGPTSDKCKESIMLEIINCTLLLMCGTVNALIPDKESLNALYEEGAYWKLVEIGENIGPTIRHGIEYVFCGIAIVIGIGFILFVFAGIIAVLKGNG